MPAPGDRGGPAALLEVADLVRHFDVSPPLLDRILGRRRRAIVRAVDGVSFAVREGETFALVGESGCGKSTVARLIVGLHRPTSGSIRFGGAEIAGFSARARRDRVRSGMQMVFQDPYASLDPRWRVRDIVGEPARGRLKRAERHAHAGRLLRSVGLAESDGGRYPHEFSGGQRQRISIARALAGEPRLLVCDEPTSALDVSVQAQILNLVRDLQRELRLTCLFISHDLAVVCQVSEHVGVMYLGRIVERGETQKVLRAPRHPYTRMLLDAIPVLEPTARRRTCVAGEPPNPLSPPPACAFHPRCPHASARCAREPPSPLGMHDGVVVACHAVEEGRL
jgi:peptide/nickel transport system ATP-binding protein